MTSFLSEARSHAAFSNPAARAGAAAVSALAWTGLALQAASDMESASFIRAMLAELAFFTIWTNFLVAASFLGLALGLPRCQSARLVTGLTLAIMMVGVVYHLLLAKLYHLVGLAALATLFMHTIVPIAAPLFWISFAPRRSLKVADPFLWAAYPVAYLVFALARGQIVGVYPYPFIDVSKIGWTEAAINSILIAAGFFVAGWTLVLIDRKLSPRFGGKG